MAAAPRSAPSQFPAARTGRKEGKLYDPADTARFQLRLRRERELGGGGVVCGVVGRQAGE